MATKSSLVVTLLLMIALLHGAVDGRSLSDERKLTAKHQSLRSATTTDSFPLRVVRPETRDSVKLIVGPDTTIKEIKTKIQKKVGIPSKFQILTYRGKKLLNSNTISDYDISGPAVFTVTDNSRKLEAKYQNSRNAGASASAYEMIPISVLAPGGKFLPLSILSHMPVKMVKLMLLSKLPNAGIMPNNMILTYNGKILVDTNTLDFYKIGPNAVLQLSVKSAEHQALAVPTPLNIKMLSGKTFLVKALSTMTIANIKAMIPKLVKISASTMRLSYMGNELDDRKTLDFYEIKPWATLDLNV